MICGRALISISQNKGEEGMIMQLGKAAETEEGSTRESFAALKIMTEKN